MRHDIDLSGPAFRLRPITDADAGLVLSLRGDSELNRYIHATPPDLSEQLAWLARYYQRPGDYYFVIERRTTRAPEGVISIYDVDDRDSSGEWGRWMLKKGSLAAVESAMLIYQCAFERLRLETVFCRTVAENVKVVSFHDSCGIPGKRLLPLHFDIGGRRVDAVEHRVTRQTWNEIAPRLSTLSQAVARRVERG